MLPRGGRRRHGDIMQSKRGLNYVRSLNMLCIHIMLPVRPEEPCAAYLRPPPRASINNVARSVLNTRKVPHMPQSGPRAGKTLPRLWEIFESKASTNVEHMERERHHAGAYNVLQPSFPPYLRHSESPTHTTLMPPCGAHID